VLDEPELVDVDEPLDGTEPLDEVTATGSEELPPTVVEVVEPLAALDVPAPVEPEVEPDPGAEPEPEVPLAPLDPLDPGAPLGVEPGAVELPLPVSDVPVLVTGSVLDRVPVPAPPVAGVLETCDPPAARRRVRAPVACLARTAGAFVSAASLTCAWTVGALGAAVGSYAAGADVAGFEATADDWTGVAVTEAWRA
jgi:hypothetical protein